MPADVNQALLASAVPSESLGQPAKMRPDRPLRLGVVGCELGRLRYHAALAAAPEITVAGVADADLTLARAWARQWGRRIPAFPSLMSLLSHSEPFEALLIASPLPERATQAAQAVQFGIPVLCETPCAPSLAETDALRRAIRENARLFLPALTRCLDPLFEEAARRIAAGELGEVKQVRCDWSLPLESAATFGPAESPNREWLQVIQVVAGQTAALCRWWLGEAHSVSADIDFPSAGQAPNSRNRGAGGATLANLIVAHAQGHATHHLSRSRARQPMERYLISGSQGQLELVVRAGEKAASTAPFPALLHHRPGQPSERLREGLPPEDAGLSPEAARARRLLRRFAACVQEGQSPLVQLEDARAAQEIVQAAVLSAQEGIKISLPLQRDPESALLRIAR
jgi:predicted dehydrogenase